jgi:hypothetical protein
MANVDGERKQAVRGVLFLKAQKKVSQTESGVNNVELIRLGDLLALRRSPTFG